MINTRAVVLEILIRYEKEGKKLRPLLLDIMGKYEELDRRDRAFIKLLTEGTVERLITLDHITDQVSRIKTQDMKPAIRMIIRMGVYQLVFMDHVPDSAAVNEAVKLVHMKHMSGLGSFVNGVLRAVERLRDEGITYPDIETEYSCPSWIADVFRREYGEERADKMIRACAGERPVYIRANQYRTSTEELITILEKEDITAETVTDAPGSIVYPHTLKITSGHFIPSESESFRKGLYSVQDLSSQIAGYALWDQILVYINEYNKVDINVIDLCAAPGGKSCFISEMCKGKADSSPGFKWDITACDISETKLEKIRENIARTGTSGIRTMVSDASLFHPEFEGKADAVIADLPCSGLGVIGRKADIKYRVRPEDVHKLCELQGQMLTNAHRYLKPGGILIFSVCTVTREETSEQSRFIDKTGLHKISERIFLQGADPCDGFYYSIWKS